MTVACLVASLILVSLGPCMSGDFVVDQAMEIRLWNGTLDSPVVPSPASSSPFPFPHNSVCAAIYLLSVLGPKSIKGIITVSC